MSKPAPLFEVRAGDRVSASVTALGRQPDRRLKFFTQIIDHDALARGEQG
ncbi:hypothetical protein AB0K00_38235 [Dactylosporangium sp. NPDC049525]